MQFIENKPFDELKVGDTAELTRTLRAHDVELFAVMSGNLNPEHIDAEFARSDQFQNVVAHGMWGGALISAVIGTELPGPGTIFLTQSLRFDRPVGIGERVCIRVCVVEKIADKRQVRLACLCTNAAGAIAIEGDVLVEAPSRKLRRPRAVLPDVHLHEAGERFRQLIAVAQGRPPIRTAVVHPCDQNALVGALDAAAARLIVPVLVGPVAKIRKAADAAKRSLDGIELVDTPHSHAAADRAVELVREGRAEALMKGALHTDELMGAVVAATTGLRTERRMSHVFALDVPTYPKPLLITDAAINIYPDLDTKRDIVQNAIDLAHALAIPKPKVAILSAVETIQSKITSTVEAAALCKMADRGQITGGVLDGPLAFDTAISMSAAAAKSLVSPVAGDPDILIVPDLEAGNMIAKQLVHLAGADAAGIVLGARVPIMLTSRADGVLSRMASCALAQLVVHDKVPGAA
jgi:phosphate acetyltransferase